MIQFELFGARVIVWGGQVILSLMTILLFWYLWRSSKDKDNPIKLSTMIVWPGTGQTSLILFLTLIGGLYATWVVVDREFRDKLDSAIFLGWMGIMIFGKAATEYMGVMRDRGPPAASPAPQFIGSAGAVNQQTPPPAAQPIPAEAATDVVPTPRKRAKRKPKGKR